MVHSQALRPIGGTPRPLFGGTTRRKETEPDGDLQELQEPYQLWLRWPFGIFSSGLRIDVRFHSAPEFHCQRPSVPVSALAGRDANPSFADAILFDIGPFDAVKADANSTDDQGFIVIRALGVDG
jgi:hypothetical protein